MSGFLIAKTQLASPYCGEVQPFTIAAGTTTNIAIGDWVSLNPTAGQVNGHPVVIKSVASNTGTPITGVVTAVDFNAASLGSTGFTGSASSVATTCYVNIDPNTYYDVDVNTGASDVNKLVATDIGSNIDLDATVATFVGGMLISKMVVLGAATLPSDVTDAFRIVEILTDSAGLFGGRARVRPNFTTQMMGTQNFNDS